MKILFIGGTGTISSACAELAQAHGFELTLLNRGNRPPRPGTRQITADISNAAATAAALGNERWDAVVDYIAFTLAELEQRIALFRGRTAQFIFISSASAYQKPLASFPITESTPLVNPFWEYSRNKIACEDRLLRALREENFPATIIRPSWTYDEKRITVPVNSPKSFTVADRLRRGQPVIVPGDGTSLWTMTHNTDFAKGLVGLLGHRGAIGHTFHITSDEVLTWNQIYEAVAEAAGAPKPKLVHIASDFITACLPEFAAACTATRRIPRCSTTARSNILCRTSSPPHASATGWPAACNGLMPTRRGRRLTPWPMPPGTSSSTPTNEVWNRQKKEFGR